MHQKPFPSPSVYMDFWYQKGRYDRHIHALSNIKTSIDDTEPEMCTRIIHQRKKTSERLLMQEKTANANLVLITLANAKNKPKKTVKSTPVSSYYSRVESPRENNLSKPSNQSSLHEINPYFPPKVKHQSPKSSLFPTAVPKHDYLTELTFSDKKVETPVESPKNSPKHYPCKNPNKNKNFNSILGFTKSNLDSITT